jgi:hypothetical protein
VAAAFTRTIENDRWLVPFVRGERHTFTLIPAPPAKQADSWHWRAQRAAGIGEWSRAWSQSSAAWRQSRGGIISVFPPMAVAAGIQQRLAVRRKPVVAWCFNVGALHGGTKGALARAALSLVDRFVVHSRAEVSRYARWLDIPPERFRFVHLQRAPIAVEECEEECHPFVLAMGSARRDYATLFESVRRSGHRTIVVAASHAIEGLDIPRNVELRSSLSMRECHRLAQRARVNVVPVLNEETASGQVTVLDAMRMGRAVVATRCIGTEDYVEDGVTGLLVKARSSEELGGAIDRMWDDRELRIKMGERAERFAAEYCSDEAAGEALRKLLDEIEDIACV